MSVKLTFLSSMAQELLVGQRLIIQAFRSYSDIPHSIGLLWTYDQPDAKSCTWCYTTPTTDNHPCSQRNSNPQSRQASFRRPAPYLWINYVARCDEYNHRACFVFILWRSNLFPVFNRHVPRRINNDRPTEQKEWITGIDLFRQKVSH